ncbi:MAG: cation:proton antiporter, partial [Nanoarchaeota archaeon]|nr:cation:proton antiporter [Nanoarchaeota archaeon]
TAVAAFILRLIRQPQILAYVLVGILITPILKIITDTSIIESMSAIGIAFLLFLVGMEMDLKALKSVALISTFGGTIQLILLFILGYIISLLLGFLNLEAAYIGLMLSFSSTMIAMKLISDKKQLNTLHGRIVIGMLLVEDLIAIFVISLLSSIDSISLAFIGVAFVKFFVLFSFAYMASKYIFPRLFHFAAKHQELLLIMSLAVCFLFSLGFFYLGFSIAIGAFVAGVTLGNLDYNLEIIGKMRSLRDFFALLFFVSLGMGLSLAVIKNLWVPLVVLTIFIVTVKPLITMTLCSLFKYTKKPSFLVAITLSEVGEFALIIAAQGLALGHLSQEIFSLTVLITIFTIMVTTYLLQYDAWVYKKLEKLLGIFDRFTTKGLEYLPTNVTPTIILCGHNRIGYSVLQKLMPVKKKVLVVDYNPEVISEMVQDGFHCLYGDITDEEILERMNLKKITMLISTVPELNDNLIVVRKTREVNKKAKIIVTAVTIDDSLKLYEHGADYVIMPHFLGGEHVSSLINNVRKRKLNLNLEKLDHIKHLKHRKGLGHMHW